MAPGRAVPAHSTSSSGSSVRSTDAGARLVVENTWKLGGTEDVAEETVTVFVHGASRFGRAIDVEIVLRPDRRPHHARGARRGRTRATAALPAGPGGAGLDVPVFKGAAMTTDRGPLAADSVGPAFPLGGPFDGPGHGGRCDRHLPPDHPGYPLPWLVRNELRRRPQSRAGPASAGAMVLRTTPVSLRYRDLRPPRATPRRGRVEEAYRGLPAGRGL
ncbi:MAG: hypothetical protein MZW92_68495 [Comamonadaceae bacterium]|nr:hypothetical protein [Comamonadaceae bacterium]